MKDYAKGGYQLKQISRKKYTPTAKSNSAAQMKRKTLTGARISKISSIDLRKIFLNKMLVIILLAIITIALFAWFLSYGEQNKANKQLSTNKAVIPSITENKQIKPAITPSPTQAKTEINDTNSTQVSNSNVGAAVTKVKEKQSDPSDGKPKFTFYNSLTDKSVKVDVEPQQIKQYNYTYMLQVGSYKDSKAANAMRARLLLIGLHPKVKKLGDWYRIDVGPVDNKRDGDILKHKLEANKISGSILRLVSKTEVSTNQQSN